MSLELRTVPVLLVFGLSVFSSVGVASDDMSVKVRWHDVQLHDEFWRPRKEAILRSGIPHLIETCSVKHCYLNNIINAGKKMAGKPHEPHRGHFWDDYFINKTVEDLACALTLDPRGNTELIEAQKQIHEKLQDWIPLYEKAQEPSGYLVSYFTLTEKPHLEDLRTKHELFLMGTLIEAGVIHYRSVRHRDDLVDDTRLLAVALRCANHLCDFFGPDTHRGYPGHAGIEFALVELAELVETLDPAVREDLPCRPMSEYRGLAEFFIDTHADPRQPHGTRWNSEYGQDHLPFVEQTRPVGHAVRANYLYLAAADIARTTRNQGYITALDRIWDNAVNRQMYLTGGMGVPHGEAYGGDYNLPRVRNYQETCASCANVMWQHRMNLLHADAKYADVMELALYNAMAAGISLDGTKYSYGNPMTATRNHSRQSWFGCACCPPNVTRMVLRAGDYVYAKTDDAICVNLYVDSTAEIGLAGVDDGRLVRIQQSTRYPRDGQIRLTVTPERAESFALRLRIPGWCEGHKVMLNDQPVNLPVSRGYVSITRRWNAGDTVTLQLPMTIRRRYAPPQMADHQGYVALQRGPLVYCAENLDGGCACCGTEFNLAKDAPLETAERDDLLGGITVITSPSRPEFEAIPYCVWNNRGPSSMAVWLSERSDSKPMIDPATAKLYEQYGQPLSCIAATASTNYSEAYNAPKAIDACQHSRWCATDGKWPQTLKVDLGKIHVITAGRLRFEYPTSAYRYSIDVSTDGNAWTMAVDRRQNATPSGEGYVDPFAPSIKARYVRITFHGSSHGWASVADVQLFGAESRR